MFDCGINAVMRVSGSFWARGGDRLTYWYDFFADPIAWNEGDVEGSFGSHWEGAVVSLYGWYKLTAELSGSRSRFQSLGVAIAFATKP